MVISLQISAVSGRVLPSCLDHSALICETVESLRTTEHASLEWIYVLGEAQKAEKKEILHLRSKVLYKKIPKALRMQPNKKRLKFIMLFIMIY